MSTPLTATPDRTPQRVRHELRRRSLTVLRTDRLTPHLIRITLGGDELAGFTSLGFDDHVKLFFPDPDTGDLVLPTMGPDGVTPPADGRRPIARDYTPRHYDAAAGTLAIDFALHEAGPATRWAEQAEAGQTLVLGGPRGSFILPTDFDWHLLVGDDTALPAMARRLAELPADARAVVLAEVDSPADQVSLPSAADVQFNWVYRSAAHASGEPPLLAALRQTMLPTGDFHAWIACETSAAKALRKHLVEECKANPKWIRASGYWRRGSSGAHDSVDD